MIKANLLKTRVTKASKNSDMDSFDIPEFSEESKGSSSDSVKALFSFLIILIFPLGLVIYEKFNLQVVNEESGKLQNELAAITADIEQKKLESDRVDSVKKKVSELELRTKEIVDLTKGRLVKIKSLDFLQNIIPERVWLVKIEARATRVILSGFAISDDDLSDFLKKLESASFYKGVVLQKTQETKTKDGLVKYFEILAQEGTDQ